MRKQEFFNLFSVAAILLLASYYWGPGALRKKMAASPSAEISVGPDGKPESAGQSDHPKRPIPPTDITSLSACKKNKLVDEIPVRTQTWRKILDKERKFLVFPRRAKRCLQKDQKLKMVEMEYDPESGFPFHIHHSLNVTVSRLSEFRAVDFSQMDFSAWNLPKSISKSLNRRAQDKKRKRKRWVLVELSAPELDLAKPRAALPLTHPRGRTYSAKEALEAVQKNGALLIDVRSKFLFDQQHPDLAIHYPFFLPVRARGAFVLSPTALMRAGLEITGPMITADRKKQIIFYGRNRSDMDPYNAVSLFAYRRFRNVGWVPGGVGELLGFELVPPSTGFNGVVTADEVLEMTKFGAVLLDVRSGPDFGYKKTAKPAIQKSYVQAPFAPDRFRLMSAGTTVEDLTRAEESWPGSGKDYAGKKVILMGSDYLDWRPWFTRKFMGDFGGSVYWYKGGLVDWVDRSRVDANKFVLKDTVPGFGDLGKRMRSGAFETLIEAETKEFESLKPARIAAQIDFKRKQNSK